MRFVNYDNFHDAYQRGIDVIRQMENLIGRFKSGDDFDEFWDISRPVLQKGKEDLEDLWEKTSKEDGDKEDVPLELSEYDMEKAIAELDTVGYLMECFDDDPSGLGFRPCDTKAVGIFLQEKAGLLKKVHDQWVNEDIERVAEIERLSKENSPTPKADSAPGAEE